MAATAAAAAADIHTFIARKRAKKIPALMVGLDGSSSSGRVNSIHTSARFSEADGVAVRKRLASWLAATTATTAREKVDSLVFA